MSGVSNDIYSKLDSSDSQINSLSNNSTLTTNIWIETCFGILAVIGGDPKMLSVIRHGEIHKSWHLYRYFVGLFLIVGIVVAILDSLVYKNVCVGYLVPIVLFQVQNIVLYIISQIQIAKEFKTIIDESKVRTKNNNIAEVSGIEIHNHDQNSDAYSLEQQSNTLHADMYKQSLTANVNDDISDSNSTLSNPNRDISIVMDRDMGDESSESKTNVCGDSGGDDIISDTSLMDWVKVKSHFGLGSPDAWLKLELFLCVVLVLIVYISGVVYAVQDVFDKRNLDNINKIDSYNDSNIVENVVIANMSTTRHGFASDNKGTYHSRSFQLAVTISVLVMNSLDFIRYLNIMMIVVLFRVFYFGFENEFNEKILKKYNHVYGKTEMKHVLNSFVFVYLSTSMHMCFTSISFFCCLLNDNCNKYICAHFNTYTDKHTTWDSTVR